MDDTQWHMAKKKKITQVEFIHDIDRSIGNKQTKKLSIVVIVVVDFFSAGNQIMLNFFCFVSDDDNVVVVVDDQIDNVWILEKKAKKTNKKLIALCLFPPTHFSLLFNGDIFVRSFVDDIFRTL